MERFRAWLRENDIVILAERAIDAERVAVRLRLAGGIEVGLVVKSDAPDKAIEVVKTLMA
jgi:hypothetical protein